MLQPFLVGKDIYLRRIFKEDLEGNYFHWLNDPEVTKWMQHGLFPNSERKMDSYYQSLENSQSDIFLAIILKEDDRHVGNVGLHRINYFFRTAEIGILVGEKDCWGRGLGTQAVKLVAEHAFLRLNLNRVFAGAVKENIGSIRIFEKAGFQREGLARESYFCEGNYRDCVQLGFLRSDWTAMNESGAK